MSQAVGRATARVMISFTYVVAAREPMVWTAVLQHTWNSDERWITHYDHTRAEMRAQTLGESGERIALPGDRLGSLRGGQSGAELVLALVNVHLVRGDSKRGKKRKHNDNSTGAHSR